MQSPSRLPMRAQVLPLATHLVVGVDASAGHITLRGELDRQTAHQLLDAARTLAAAGHSHWVINAHDLHFCDASGLRAISVTYRRALRHGATLSVVGAGRWLRRALATIHLHHHVFAEPRGGTAVQASPEGYVPATYPLAKSAIL